MFRLLRVVLPLVSVAGALLFSSCVGTIYDPMYSNRKTHFKAPEERTKDVSAEALLGPADKKADAAALDAAGAGGLPPPEVPGLPPAGLPDPNAAPAPAAPPAAPPQ